MTSTTLLACTVVNTRWPVSADLNGDLRRFGVADFADHDLVRVVAQDRAQPAGEGQPLLLVYRNLRNAANLVFDRVFDGDDLVFVGLDLVQRGVKRGGLAGAGRAGHQHHAVRFRDVAAEAARSSSPKPTTSSVSLWNFSLIDSLSRMRSTASSPWIAGHDGDAEVDGAPVVAHAEAAVLRHAPLGDVEFGHDLDTRDDGGVMLLRDRFHRLLQHAVDAVLDDDRIVASLDVDVAGTPLQGGEDGGVDQADDRTDVALRRSAVRSRWFSSPFSSSRTRSSVKPAWLLQYAL